MNGNVPAEVFPPGDFLREELEEREWSQSEFAEILGRPARVVSEILSGKRAITPETAKGIAAALGTSAHYWLNLESSYQLSKVADTSNDVAKRADLFSRYPVKEMAKRGWIEGSKNVEVLERRLGDFFGKFGAGSTAIAHRAKSNGVAIEKQFVWLVRARALASHVAADKFSVSKLKLAVNSLRDLLESPESTRNVPTILAKAGVRFVVLEALPGTKIDGACFWLDKNSPVVAMSLRYDRIGSFWHTLFHELDHVAHGEGKRDAIVEEVDPSWIGDPIEKRANETGADNCIPKSELDEFIARLNPYFSKSDIVGFAKRIHVHPGIVVGQLQFMKLVPYSHHRSLLVPVRAHVINSAFTDGFGQLVNLDIGA